MVRFRILLLNDELKILLQICVIGSNPSFFRDLVHNSVKKEPTSVQIYLRLCGDKMDSVNEVLSFGIL